MGAANRAGICCRRCHCCAVAAAISPGARSSSGTGRVDSHRLGTWSVSVFGAVGHLDHPGNGAIERAPSGAVGTGIGLLILVPSFLCLFRVFKGGPTFNPTDDGQSSASGSLSRSRRRKDSGREARPPGCRYKGSLKQEYEL